MNYFSFRSFKKEDIPYMRKAFNKAFEDYLIHIKLTDSEFKRKIIEKTNINFKYSIGSYYQKELVGFLFHTIEIYQNQKTAYNGGTGVIPSFRGNNLTYQMYQFVIPKLKKSGVENCVLEVISNNKPAIRSYEKSGFIRSKFYHCLKLEKESIYLKKKQSEKFILIEPVKPKWHFYERFCDYDTSFLDTFTMLKKNIKFEKVVEAYLEEKLVGYIIYNKKMGRVANIAVDKRKRGMGIATALINRMHMDCCKRPIYILNVDEKSYDLLSFFLRIGFKNDIDQFELKLKLTG
jgi:ribosomal protein S18 acetylase RimI-like enzyme